MTLSQLRDYFIMFFPWAESCSVGKIDKNKDNAVCFYVSKLPRAKVSAFGGKQNRGSDVKPVTVLLRYGRNAPAAEQMAEEIYDFFDETTFYIDDKRVFVISRYDGPIPYGTDDRGVYEYSFEFDFYIEKGRCKCQQ